eukprot:TRINITY_DN63141_c0_g1_i1.p1 TRINITY_DN63141_c0_g1~~TRINITY_DN63141_c0_g1_i1.p1  ORF type:complete len:806 (+),score=185.22 TRINITY_DN63141_c0_g1_i1:78-2420(+)
MGNTQSQDSSDDEVFIKKEEEGSAFSCSPEVLDESPRTEEPACLVSYDNPSGPWYRCQPNAEVKPRMAKMGLASEEKSPPQTLPEILRQVANGAKGEEEFLKVERPLPPLDKDSKPPPALPRDEWTTWTFEEVLEEAENAAKGFIRLGLQMHESVNVWGFNSPEWFLSTYGANFAGAKVAGIYPTDTAETAAYKIVHSGGGIAVVEDQKKLDNLSKALNGRGDCRRLKAFVTYGFEPAPNQTTVIGGRALPVLGWKSLLDLGEKFPQGAAELKKRADATRPGHCAALIYTSGTTGDPKAVMISHDNIIFEATCVLNMLAQYHDVGNKEEEERILSYLPLSHVAGMMVDIVCPIVAAARSKAWATVFFARNYDLKAGSIKDRLCCARPTLFLGVPLVWEKIADRIRAIGAETTGAKKMIADYAKSLGLAYAQSHQRGGSGHVPMGYSLVNSAVLSQIKANLGLDACKFGFTGAAPIRVDTLEYFGSLGLSINEVYGMSECSGACTISVDACHEWGSCGWELPGFEVKVFNVDAKDFNKKTEVDPAPDLECVEERYQGELCYRGRSIMMGYMAQPDLGHAHVMELEKKTAETIDRDGWLHSGDKGMITVAGMVKITGRYKELIIGDGGENIAPVPIEDQVKKACDGIAEVMMVGDKRKYNVALITLKAKGANGEVPGTDQLDAGAARVNPAVTTISAAMDDKIWIDAVTKAVKAANENGKVCPNNAFKIQKFTILPTNFSEEKNELTPTKKLKRKNVEDRYKELIEKMYKTDGTYIKFEKLK